MINVFGAKLGDEELQEIESSMNSSWMGMGDKVKQFEKELSYRLGFPLTMVDSGSNALLLAIHLLRLPPHSKIILPSFTWVSCASAILLAGHIPVFADVDEDTQNITPKAVFDVFDDDTKAIMVVHYAGKPVDVELFKEFNVPIIEDAAHAVDSKLRGISCGGFGDVAVFSFDSIKNLATPEGGGIVFKNPELVKEYRYCGIGKSGFANAADNAKGRWWEYNIKHLWHKMLPNDISASVGLAQLKKLDKLQNRRKQIWEIYQKEFVNFKCPVDPSSEERHSYFTYFIQTKNRDNLAKYLLDNGVYTTLRYHPLHLNSIYNSVVRLPITEKLNEEGLNLPLHPSLDDEDVGKIVDLIKKWKN